MLTGDVIYLCLAHHRVSQSEQLAIKKVPKDDSEVLKMIPRAFKMILRALGWSQGRMDRDSAHTRTGSELR